ncbi:MAG: hypothetical protein ACYDC3_00060 [Candidatus Binataceae bacterium]
MNTNNPPDESGSPYYLSEPQPDLDMVSVLKGTPHGAWIIAASVAGSWMISALTLGVAAR